MGNSIEDDEFIARAYVRHHMDNVHAEVVTRAREDAHTCLDKVITELAIKRYLKKNGY